MYYLIYDPDDNGAIQISTTDWRDTVSTQWIYNGKQPFWDECDHDTKLVLRVDYHNWLTARNYIELLVSEHPITAESHPELLL